MQQKRGRAGFTLVEVMVSLAIFLIASMGLLPLLLTGLQVNRGTSLDAQARRLAGEALAELQLVDYATLATLPANPWLVGDIEVERRIEPSQPLTGMCRLTVVAQWQRRGRRHAYQLQTVRAAP
jgi:prepilin-type N-terminal cleavage/methylation domain-containing protein